MPCLCPPQTSQGVLSAGAPSLGAPSHSRRKHLRQLDIRDIRIQPLSTAGDTALTVLQIIFTAFKFPLSDQPKYVIGNDVVLNWLSI